MMEAAKLDLSMLSLDDLLRRRRALRKALAAQWGLEPIRIAVLGGSTSEEVVDLLELRLLNDGFRPEFYQSAYAQFVSEAVQDSRELVRFQPQLVYVHTSFRNLQRFGQPGASDAVVTEHVEAETMQYRMVWDALGDKLACQIVQNNFEHPPIALLGNLDAVEGGGQTRFVAEMNVAFAREARRNPRLILQDVCGMSARLGLQRWFDDERWFTAKMVTTPEGSDEIARSLTAICRALRGRARKVLVLDLDQTLWGGTIGDDGVERIAIGSDDAVGEAYSAFQRYCLRQRERGVLLAVCSKNDEAVALSGLDHPDSVLRREHFASFQANWNPKPENIQRIAAELNLSPDSFVFVDDNPAERALVRAQIEGIAVPEVGDDVTRFIDVLEQGRYFETIALSDEDLLRAESYRVAEGRSRFEGQFADYGAYLDSLEMTARIEPIPDLSLERVVQLTNKTNQFNLTTQRYTPGELKRLLAEERNIGLCGRLRDRFGDHGLISVMLGRRTENILFLDLWLMSCRVLKRGMEEAMLDEIVRRARAAGVEELRGEYVASGRNAMVADLYPALGFTSLDIGADGVRCYRLALDTYQQRNRRIAIEDREAD